MTTDGLVAFLYVGAALGTHFDIIKVVAELSEGRPAILARSLADLLTPESNSDMPTRLSAVKGDDLKFCGARVCGRKM